MIILRFFETFLHFNFFKFSFYRKELSTGDKEGKDSKKDVNKDADKDTVKKEGKAGDKDVKKETPDDKKKENKTNDTKSM